MTFENFTALFRKATGNPNPFPYQERFAEADELPDLRRRVRRVRVRPEHHFNRELADVGAFRRIARVGNNIAATTAGQVAGVSYQEANR